MADVVTAYAGTSSGWESRRSPRVSELWTVTGGSGGSADGSAGSITTRMKKPEVLVGAVSYAISSNVVTLTTITALAEGEVIAVEVIGYL